MRFEKLRFRNIGVFRGEHEFDFTAYQGPLVAVTGENGSGKTTMLELLLGALRRRCPTRGSLASLATGRDSFVEVTVVVGRERRIVRQLIDGTSGKGECIIVDDRGIALIDSAKVRAGDDYVEKNFPSETVLLASVFSYQGSSGFLGAKPADRKEILLQLLGPEMERLEAYAVEARERVKATKAELATLDARMADERSRGGDVDALTTERAGAVLDADGARSKAEHLAGVLDALKVEALRIDAAAEAARQLEERRAEAVAAHAAAAETVRDLDVRIANNRSVMARAPQINAAVDEAARLDAEGQAEQVERQRVTDRSREMASEADRHRVEARRCRERVAEEQQRVARLTAALELAADIARAVADRPAAEAARVAAAEALDAADAELERLRGLRLAGADGRIVVLRGGLTSIANRSRPDPATVALETLEADTTAEQTAATAPAQIRAAEKSQAELRQALKSATAESARLNELAARIGEVEHNRAALVDASTAVEHWKAAAVTAEQLRDEADQKVVVIVQEGEPFDVARANRLTRLEALAPLLKLAKPLEEAEIKLAGYLPLAERAREAAERLQLALLALPEAAAVPPLPDVAGADQAARVARQAADEAAKRRTLAEQRLELAKASSERLALLEADRQGVDAELSDWTRLAADLGKDGLQAMVIDQAIPELNELTNSLLHAAFGSRWTVDVRTQSSDAKGRRLLETLDVWFIDTERGREGLAETLSGGEKTIVAEALSLALTAIACRQAGAERPTLIRDESAGQLSPGKARAWIEMMRRAADIIGVDRILFVNHNPETWELADARIEVRSTGAAA